jgi:hypothetical protein
MATPTTTLIARAIRTALAATVGDDARVWAFGAVDDTAAPSRAEQFPDVWIRVREPSQQQYKSVLRDYPVDIVCRVHSASDRMGEALQSLARTVSDWIRGAPALTASGLTIHSLYMPDAPEDADEQREGGSVWGYRWTGTAKTQKTS